MFFPSIPFLWPTVSSLLRCFPLYVTSWTLIYWIFLELHCTIWDSILYNDSCSVWLLINCLCDLSHYCRIIRFFTGSGCGLPLFILFLSPSSYSRNPVTGGARLISWLGLLLLFFCYLVYFNKLTWNIIILSLNWSSMKHPQLSCLHFPWFLSSGSQFPFRQKALWCRMIIMNVMVEKRCKFHYTWKIFGWKCLNIFHIGF